MPKDGTMTMDRDLEAAFDPKTSPDILARMARERGPGQERIRAAVAAHPNTDKETRTGLAFDADPGVRRAVAACEQTPVQVLALFEVSPHLQRGGAHAALSARKERMSPEERKELQQAAQGVREGAAFGRRLARDGAFDARIIAACKAIDRHRENVLAKRLERGMER